MMLRLILITKSSCFSLLLFMWMCSISLRLSAQQSQVEQLGFRLFQMHYKGDTINILVKSKKGDEHKIKPVLFFCQGSLPKPLVITDGNAQYNVFPFSTDTLEQNYHLVIVGKPGVPLIADVNILGPNHTYINQQTGRFMDKYNRNNYLSYYVNRNLKVFAFLRKQHFVSTSTFVVAGHSEGATIAAHMAKKSSKVTHLIFASGNPLGRIMTMISSSRQYESDTDSTRYAEFDIEYWKEAVMHPNDTSSEHGDSYKLLYDYSIPPMLVLQKLKIPVLVCYGTKDNSAPFNDYFRVNSILQYKRNLTFKAYVGLEHNFFGVDSSGKINHEIFGWNRVANDWNKWLRHQANN